MKQEIKQITTVVQKDGKVLLHALCNDSSVWQKSLKNEGIKWGDWVQIGKSLSEQNKQNKHSSMTGGVNI